MIDSINNDDSPRKGDPSNANVVKVFNYNGSNITFQLGNGDLLVNATEILKFFPNKVSHISDFWKTSEAFVDVLAKSLNISDNEIPTSLNFEINGTFFSNKYPRLVKVVKGGLGKQGTWMHQKLALKFAAWLSPDFELWMLDRIEELMKYGMTATAQTLEDMLSNPDLVIGLASKLKESRERERQLELESAIEKGRRELAEKTIKQQAPMVSYVEDVLKSDSNIKISVIASEFGLTGNALNKELYKMGIQHKVNGVWILYAKYQGLGYTKTETHTYTDKNGKDHTSLLTVWTEKGRHFLHSLLDNPKAA